MHAPVLRLIRWSILTLAAIGWAVAATAAEVEKGAAPQPPAAANSNYAIGISPFLETSSKDEVYRAIVRLLVEDLPLNSKVVLYDAFALKTITRVNVPGASAFRSAKTRANQFAPAIGEVKQFLAQDHPKPQIPSGSHLDFTSAIRFPQFCDFLTANMPADAFPLNVLVIGSPLYQDAKEPAFSMNDGYFPSDGHLQASVDKSVYGFSENPGPARPLVVHWLYVGDPWVNELHKQKISRFWGLYLERRHSQLLSFTADTATAVKRLEAPGTENAEVAQRWQVNPDDTKIEMLRITRDVGHSDWLTRDRIESPSGPPNVLTGPMKIGIRWAPNIDLDLYATPRPGAETLFFQHTRSPEGYYYKDHRSSPGREYEFIEFEKPVDARQVEAFVNFYKGHCPGGPHGEVRIEFDGRIYAAPFAISAEEGNRGQTGPSQDGFWTPIPVQQILKLALASSRE
jgi:hypothetical protein